MKKWVAYIVSLYILFCAIVPCAILDNCEQDEYTAQTSHNDTKKDCNNCSPFSICSSTHSFTLSTVTTAIEPVVLFSAPSYSEYYFYAESAYYPSFFQPPRVG